MLAIFRDEDDDQKILSVYVVIFIILFVSFNSEKAGDLDCERLLFYGQISEELREVERFSLGVVPITFNENLVGVCTTGGVDDLYSATLIIGEL